MQKKHKDKHFIKKPIYEGGPKAIRQFIAQHLKYPKAALEQKIEGTVALKYSIGRKGKVTDVKVISSVGHGCDEEAIRLVKMLEFKIPKTRGVKITFYKSIKIHFRLKTIKKTAPKANMELKYQVIASKTKKEKGDENTKGYSYTINI